MKTVSFFVLGFFLFQASCATIVKSERTMVTFSGGLEDDITKIDIPDGQYTTKNGSTTVLVSRSKQDIPITVTCNDQSMSGIIKTSYDPLAGFLGSIFLGGLIGIGIDAIGNKTYDPPASYNISPLCARMPKNQDLEEDSGSNEDDKPTSRNQKRSTPSAKKK